MSHRHIAMRALLVASLCAGWAVPSLAGAQRQPRRPHDSQASQPSQPAPRQGTPGGQEKAKPRDDRPDGQAAPRHGSPSRPPDAAARRRPPDRQAMPPRYWSQPRTYFFPPIDTHLGFYYHPYFGFYYGPYYGPFYPYPGPFIGRPRYSSSALRLRVKPVEAEVYLNGYYAGVVDDFDGIFQRLYVPAGDHEIEIRMRGFETFHQHVYVSAGDTLDIAHALRPLRAGEADAPMPKPRALPPEWTAPDSGPPADDPASPYGILAVRIDPPDAQVFIDGEAWEAVAGQAELVVHLPAGWHTLEVRKDGYRPFSTKIEVGEGQRMRLRAELER